MHHCKYPGNFLHNHWHRQQSRNQSNYYHILNKKSKVEGVCDLCGGKTVIRKDDQPATVLDRLKAYHEQTEPLVEFYRTRGKLAEIKFCPSIEETTAEVMKALEA